MQEQELSGPLVDVEQVSQSVGADLNTWNVSWRIGNLGSHPLRILSVRLPHGRFRGKEINLLPIQELGTGESTHIETQVVCKESSGTVVENAFFILRVLWRGKAWLILARMRVIFDEQEIPRGRTEVITTQPVGFSSREG